MFDQPFGLRVGQVLTRDKDMLVERHGGSHPRPPATRDHAIQKV
jgi:hypothetical protein